MNIEGQKDTMPKLLLMGTHYTHVHTLTGDDAQCQARTVMCPIANYAMDCKTANDR